MGIFSKKLTEPIHKEWGNALREPDFVNGFIANGKLFKPYPKLCVDRFIAFQKLEIEAGLGVSFKSNYDTFQNIYNLANKPMPEPGRIAVLANDAMLAISNLDGKYIPALLICTLFLVTEDEDLKVYDQSVMEGKIDAWQKEGYDIQSFLKFALSCIQGFSETYAENSQQSLKAKESLISNIQ